MIREALIGAAIGAALASGATWRVLSWRHAAELAEQQEAAREMEAQRAKQADAAAASFESERARLAAQFRVITKEVDHVVEKPVYRNVCIDADGLRLIAGAVGAQ